MHDSLRMHMLRESDGVCNLGQRIQRAHTSHSHLIMLGLSVLRAVCRRRRRRHRRDVTIAPPAGLHAPPPPRTSSMIPAQAGLQGRDVVPRSMAVATGTTCFAASSSTHCTESSERRRRQQQQPVRTRGVQRRAKWGVRGRRELWGLSTVDGHVRRRTFPPTVPRWKAKWHLVVEISGSLPLVLEKFHESDSIRPWRDS
eukprot:COSAG01_NODE_15415_length_1340_cov_1.012893_2_plen_199_part_00